MVSLVEGRLIAALLIKEVLRVSLKKENSLKVGREG